MAAQDDSFTNGIHPLLNDVGKARQGFQSRFTNTENQRYQLFGLALCADEDGDSSLEVCDGNSIDCTELDSCFTGGRALCNPNGDTADCTKIDANYESGTAYCNETCDGWLTHECVLKEFCGDGIRNADELCDSERKLCSEIDSQYVEGYADCAGSCDHWKTGNCVVGDQPHQVTVSESGALSQNQWIHFGPFLASSGDFQVVMTGRCDADLYVAKGAQPSSQQYDCRSAGYRSDENCSEAAPGSFYVSVYGYASSSSYTLSITYYPNSPD